LAREEVKSVGMTPFFFGFGLVLTVVAVIVDVRTGRGYGVGLLSLLLLVGTLVLVLSATVLASFVPPPPDVHSLGYGTALFLYVILAGYITFFTLVAAVIEAGIAGHWLWISGFIVSVLVPILVTALPYSLGDVELILRNVGFVGIVASPEAVMLAYSITRLVHPVAVPIRQPAPLG
jgi:hypothetical protein